MEQSKKSKIRFEEKVKLGKSDELNLVCDNCGTAIEGVNININSSLAQCNSCKSVFKINDDLFFAKKKKVKPEMIMPPGTDVLELSDSLDIRIDWLKSHPQGTLGFFTFFTIFWNGILALIAGGTLVSGEYGFLLYMSIHLIIGLGLLYYLASVYFNYTDVIVNKTVLQIDHRPIKNPFIRSKKIDIEELDQLYVTKYVASKSNDRPNYAYALYAILKSNGKKIVLIKGMNRETQLYLEQEIERYLDIKDRYIFDAIDR
jgi:hypothetical protein